MNENKHFLFTFYTSIASRNVGILSLKRIGDFRGAAAFNAERTLEKLS
jgi:hypothetical protein